MLEGLTIKKSISCPKFKQKEIQQTWQCLLNSELNEVCTIFTG